VQEMYTKGAGLNVFQPSLRFSVFFFSAHPGERRDIKSVRISQPSSKSVTFYDAINRPTLGTAQFDVSMGVAK